MQATNRRPVGCARLVKCAASATRGLAMVLGLAASADGFEEPFASPPDPVAWRTFGDASLFAWDADAQALRVTWDSSRPNSFFAHPLGTILNRYDDFKLGFALRLDQVAVAVNPDKTYTFELAIGLLNWSNATNAAFRRGTGSSSPNLVELDYFPDSGYGATLWPTVIAGDGRFNYNGSEDFTLLELEPGHVYRVEMNYTAADQTLRTSLWRDGAATGPVHDVPLASRFTDFRVDTFAVASYSDDGTQGSLLASGIVDDIVVEVPPPPVGPLAGAFVGAGWQVEFAARTNWVYSLERTTDLAHWTAVRTNTVVAANGPLVLADPSPPTAALYRVRADKP